MPVLPADLEERYHGCEKSHQKGSRATDAPSGVVGIDHRGGGNGPAQFLIGPVNGSVRRTERTGGLGQGALAEPDAGGAFHHRRDLAQGQAEMIVQGERMGHDLRTGAVRGGSVLPPGQVRVASASAPSADRAAALLHVEAADLPHRLRQGILHRDGFHLDVQPGTALRTIRRIQRRGQVLHLIHGAWLRLPATPEAAFPGAASGLFGGGL